jgi:hypothetical protein
MTEIRIKLSPRENAKAERLRALWGLKSKEKAIKKAVQVCPEFDLLEDRYKKKEVKKNG